MKIALVVWIVGALGLGYLMYVVTQGWKCRLSRRLIHYWLCAIACLTWPVWALLVLNDWATTSVRIRRGRTRG